ncbi:MAG: Asp/Glu/hydantoin racemase [Rhodospirillaceae bacterium]|jgi:maleate isomerase|nr:Asp/Glu/hydantoin racemase [Rhodospirillaceae bacterium]MBT4490035.1 Asp/Glu/hydantoin racemase [Rhodospirillaceae bacterium]MBT5897426.1 Asp/Glu/hydantoin racemase [Rhodospirillaceae bacterium]MBT6428349.1 Asp/Glu/hydantoin racemase [Rhodospirillaceae bacterium]MBT7759737.1 Asp/Glu/hydantoin racemase [Rhodospirillaceae bacterium]
MTERTLLGMLTPSSNTVLEPTTTAMLHDLDGVTAHFSRFKVTEITLSEHGLAQFDHDRFLAAADLLADAKCQAIAWNGTSAGWLGFANDEALCARITESTGAPATTSILANNDLFRRHGVRKFGLVTPYTDDVQARILEIYRAGGFECVSERHLGISDNFSFSEITEAQVEAKCREVAAEGAEAISIICTNMRGAALAERLEAELDVTIYDSISVVVLRALELAGLDAARVRGWGRIFAL